jgi:hypothetical protein
MTIENCAISLQNLITAPLGYGENRLTVREKPTKKMVNDFTLKYYVMDESDRNVAFILLSNNVFNDLIDSTAKAAQNAYQILGDGLSDLVVKPLFTGFLGKNSYAVFPYYEPLNDNRMTRIVIRQTLAKTVLDWVEQVARRTTLSIDEGLWEDLSVKPLLWLNECPLVDKEIRSEALDALKEMKPSRWTPKCVFSHNDLWYGNILVKPIVGGFAGRNAIGDPRIIDWLGSSKTGIPGFDFINFANSTGISSENLAPYMARVNKDFEQSFQTCYYDLLAGFGRLGLNRGEFPLDRFAVLVNKTVNTYKNVACLSGYPLTRL